MLNCFVRKSPLSEVKNKYAKWKRSIIVIAYLLKLEKQEFLEFSANVLLQLDSLAEKLDNNLKLGCIFKIRQHDLNKTVSVWRLVHCTVNYKGSI